VKPSELAALVGDPAVVEALRQHLGLPSEPVAAELCGLAEAHARLDRMGRVEAALDRLTEAQARTDLSVQKLVEGQAQLFAGQAQLFEGQARTDLTVQKLVEGKARTDMAVQQLVEAQARTDLAVQRLDQDVSERTSRLEEAMAKLVESHAALRTEFGGLSQTIGFTIEDVARTVLPGWLERHERVVVESLEREFVKTATGEEEIDLFARCRIGDSTT
jgi:hypothetical protein